tara:strand:+ start:297 stop:452 length:156 start_codon:yes stop_codon:yes gene_type:complete
VREYLGLVNGGEGFGKFVNLPGLPVLPVFTKQEVLRLVVVVINFKSQASGL